MSSWLGQILTIGPMNFQKIAKHVRKLVETVFPVQFWQLLDVRSTRSQVIKASIESGDSCEFRAREVGKWM